MLSYIIIILLLLILAMLFYSIFGSSKKQETVPPQIPDRRLLENQLRIFQEISELKKSLEQFQMAFEKESEQWRTVNQHMEAAVDQTPKSLNKQHLLLQDRYREIFELYGQGLTAEEIAKKLNKGYGEVAFILELAAQDRT